MPDESYLPAQPEDEAAEWTAEDEFDPHYCVRCRKRIPIAVSERQGACDDCLDILDHLGSTPVAPNLAAYGVGPHGSAHPVCPKCHSGNVVREWVTDWMSAAVDIATVVACAALAGAGSRVMATGRTPATVMPDNSPDAPGRVKVMRHRCTDCGFHWKAV